MARDYVLTARIPEEVAPDENLGRGVFSDYHADIVLPDKAADEREEQKQHAQELADAAQWLPRPAQEEER